MPSETVLQGAAVAALRQCAQARAATMPHRELSDLSPEEVRRLLHELRLDPIELEMQSEELRRAQVELERSRARYFDLYHLAPVGYLTLSEEGTILEANLRAAALLGTPSETLMKRTLSRFILSADADVYHRYHRQLWHSGEPQTCEVRLASRRAGAAISWVRLEAALAKDEEQQATVCRVVLTDITESRCATEALAEREERQRLILDHLSVGVVFADIAGTAFYHNPRFTELFGYTLPQFPTLAAWWSLAHPKPADREQVVAEWNRRLAEALRGGGEIRPMEVVITCADGTEKDVSVTARVIGDRLFVTFIDLTERRAAEEVVRASESRYRDLYENAPVAYFSVGSEGRIRRCNRKAAQMLGYTIEQLVGRPIVDLYADTPHGKPEAHRVFQRFLAREPIANQELQMTRADGTLVWISLSVTAILDATGAVVESRSTVIDITERKEAEVLLEARVQERTRDLQAEIAEQAVAQAALQRSQTSLADAERIARLGSWEIDLATGELWLSDEMKRIFGFDHMERPITRADIFNAIHPDDRSAVQAAMGRAMQPGQVYRAQYRLVLSGGETRVVYAEGELLRDAAGQPARIRGMVQDITERERVKDALDQRVRELSSLQVLSSISNLRLSLEEIVHLTLDKIVTLAGLDMARLFLLREHYLYQAGAHPGEVVLEKQPSIFAEGECLCGLAVRDGRPAYTRDFGHDERCSRPYCLAQGLRSVVALPLRSGEAVVGVLALGSIARDAFAGRLTFLETVAEQIALGLQNALLHQEIQDRAAGLEESVAERTRELQTERDRTQAILDTSGESVVVTDLQGQMLFLNPATTTLTGFSRNELLGQPLWRHWSIQSLAHAWLKAQQALRAGRTWEGEITGYRKDGTIYTAVLTGAPLYDERATPLPTGGVWAQRDITALKEAERLKDLFISNVTHELRTPISVIMLSCDNLAAFYDRLDEDQRRQMLRDLHAQAHILNEVVEDILTLSRIDSGSVDATQNPVDLACLARDEVAKQRLRAEARSQCLSAAAPDTVFVIGNEVQLRRVLRNLLDNAIKYTPDGGRICCTCEVRVLARAVTPEADTSTPATWAVFEIRDEGIGIPSEAIPLLFDRFFRVNGEGGVPGAGLGLSIARELVLMHDGWIDVVSAPGEGSTFTVYLPLAERGSGGRGQRSGVRGQGSRRPTRRAA